MQSRLLESLNTFISKVWFFQYLPIKPFLSISFYSLGFKGAILSKETWISIINITKIYVVWKVHFFRASLW